MDAVQKLVELLKLVLTWWFFVEPWERVVRLRAGKRLTVCGPGVHFKVPVVDTIYRHNIRRMVSYIPVQTVSSQDGQVFAVSASVSHEIVDVEKLHTSVHDAEGVLTQEVSQLAAEYIHSRQSAAITPEGLRRAIERVDLSRFGLGSVTACVENFATVRTYRLISEGIRPQWRADVLSLHTVRKEL